MTTKRISRRWTATALLTAACSLLLLSLALPGYAFPEAKTEAQSRLIGDVKYLASDELEGRGVGTEGLDVAADYIRNKFLEAGLSVDAVDGDAFHKFSMVTGAELGETNTLQFTLPDGSKVALDHDRDFRTCSFGGAGTFSGEIVFCGYGIDAEDKEYREFEGLDVKGKTVIIMRRTPQQGNPHGAFGEHGRNSIHAALRTKVSNANAHDAAAILFVNDPYSIRQNAERLQKRLEKAEDEVVAAAEAFDAADGEEEADAAEAREKLADSVRQLKKLKKQAEKANHDELMKFGYNGYGSEKALPIMHISRETCDRVLEATLKKSLAEIEAEIDHTLKPQSAVLAGVTVEGETSLERVREEVKNVIGVLEGEGPLADETIVIGAHYDHVGRGKYGSLSPGSNEIHNGADDNGSGTAGLIELARRFAQREEKLPRRLVFIAFTAEELGLVGSAKYVENPVFPLEKTVAMFNMDMIGRMQDEKLTVFGSGTAKHWEPLLKKHAGGLKLTFKPEGLGPSDHSSFYAKKIPVLHFFTGTHSDYHRPGDDYDKINVRGMAETVDLIEQMVLETALSEERPQYVAVKGRANVRRSGSRPYFGSIPDFSGEAEGYAISGVSPDSPADKGGLKGGDVIVQLDEYKVTDLNDFDLALRKLSPGEEVEVIVLREGERLKLKVTLAKPK